MTPPDSTKNRGTFFVAACCGNRGASTFARGWPTGKLSTGASRRKNDSHSQPRGCRPESRHPSMFPAPFACPMSALDSVWFATLSDAERLELSPGATEVLKSPDVLVVGGGIIGLATAYFLAERGAKVQLIEAATLAS